MGQTRYPSKGWVFKSRSSSKVTQYGKQQLQGMLNSLQNGRWCPSFSQPYLRIQSLRQSPPKICSSTLVSFDFPVPPLLVHKIIRTIPTNTPFLYTSTVFHIPSFAHNHPNNLHQKYCPFLSNLASSGYVKGPGSEGVLWGMTLI